MVQVDTAAHAARWVAALADSIQKRLLKRAAFRFSFDVDMAFCHRTALAPEKGRGPLCGKDRQWQNAISTLYILRSHLREEEYILDGRGVGHEHCQTVDSHAES